MNDKIYQMPVIGYTSYVQFREKIVPEFVLVDVYEQSRTVQGIAYLDFYVIASAISENAYHVCRLAVARSVPSMFDDQVRSCIKTQDNLRKEMILDLELHGNKVRPGIYADANRSDQIASPDILRGGSQ